MDGGVGGAVESCCPLVESCVFQRDAPGPVELAVIAPQGEVSLAEVVVRVDHTEGGDGVSELGTDGEGVGEGNEDC